jgi:PKD repeat protein
MSGLGNYTGVAINTFCEMVGGLHAGQILRVRAADNLTQNFTYAQVNGDFATYDATGQKVTHNQSLTTVLAYHFNDNNLTSDGPLRFAVVGPEGLYTNSSYWVQKVVRLEILGTAEYSLTVTSSPTGVNFTVDGASQVTSWSGTYGEGSSVSLVMPEVHTVGEARYYWDQWNDGNASRSRTVTITQNTTLTAYYDGPYYELTVNSSPIAGISFTINGTSETTPYSEWLLEGSYTLVMPETHGGYAWSHWIEDGNVSRVKTISLDGSTTWTAGFAFAVPPYGPTATFTVTPETVNAGDSVRFDASSSQPGWNGTHEMPITQYRWDFGDGNETTTTTPIVYHIFTGSGNYYVKLTVYSPGATPETSIETHKVTVVIKPVGGYSITLYTRTKAVPITLGFLIPAISASVLITLVSRKKTRKKH